MRKIVRMPSKTTVRIADQSDLNEILDMLWEMHLESGMGSLSVDRVQEKVSSTFSKGLIIISENGQKITGSIGLNKFQFWWSDDWALADQWSFVRKKHRKSKAFLSLVKKAKEISLEAKVPLLLANFGTVEEERKTKLFSRIGVKMGTTVITGDTSRFLWRK